MPSWYFPVLPEFGGMLTPGLSVLPPGQEQSAPAALILSLQGKILLGPVGHRCIGKVSINICWMVFFKDQ